MNKTTPGPGVLSDLYHKVRESFYHRMDETVHAATYEGVHDLPYAEPEFTGKFMDICACFYRTEGDPRALKKGMTVAESVIRNQREDGYLGTLSAGNEREAFSLWNHGFTMLGLSRLYEVTGNEAILDSLRKAADYILELFRDPSSPDILDAINGGSEHIAFLYAILGVYRITGEKSYLDFVERVLRYLETTDMNLLSFNSIYDLRSRKGIEMLIVFLGVLTYGRLSGNEKAVAAAVRYWREIASSQIRNTGNGTLGEQWTEGGNAARLLATDEKPNETCVAAGWIELSLALFWQEPKSCYLDAVETTLFNHILGSFEKEGTDFAYYQGNYGRKVYHTEAGMYQCCRYRGFTLLSYLKDYLYFDDGTRLIPVIYGASSYEAPNFSVKQKTDYPKNGRIEFSVRSDSDRRYLLLRIPAWCGGYRLTVNGEHRDNTAEEGYLSVALPHGQSTVVLELDMTLRVSRHTIDGKPFLSASFGPLLLAADTHYGNTLWQEAAYGVPERIEPCGSSMVQFVLDGVHLVDFASAGGNDPENDRYTVFIPEKTDNQ